MPTGTTLLGLTLNDWAAIATMVNGVTVVVLVVVNILYVRTANRQTQAALTQAQAALAQAKEGQRQADSASESLRLLKAQLSDQSHRELVRAISILDEVQNEVMFWTGITDNKWGMAPANVNLLPDDSTIVLLQAGRISLELRKEVGETFRMIANANYQIPEFLVAPQTYR